MDRLAPVRALRPAVAPRAAICVSLLLAFAALAQDEPPAAHPATAAAPAEASVATAPGAGRAAATVFAGWQRVLTATTYAERYVPASLLAAVERGEAVPAVVFLHGAGARPEQYRAFAGPAAESAGCVVVLPRSHGVGWGYSGDVAAVTESLRSVADEVPLDPLRTAIAGHSAGGAYAALLTYRDGEPFSAVYSLAAPFAPVSELAPGAGTAVIRMDYGSRDPLYTGGAGTRFGAQWDRLGVAWQQRVHAGLGHNDLTPGMLGDGFAFLVAQRIAADRCLPSETAHCLQDGRFRVEAAWQTPAGAVGDGRVVPGTSSGDSGLFWFFHPANWELLVKVLDGCPVNGRYWVFAAATTHVGHTITVTDTATGAVWSHRNPVGQAAPAVTATDAFDTCG